MLGGEPASRAGPTLAQLERGATGDALWDDAQRQLALSGELHNNVRMAWGKAVPGWHAAALPADAAVAAGAPSAAVRLQAALDLLVRLNDRFALDGGAPPSYGGVLWCLGWRDRPGPDGCPTARPTTVLARRFRPGQLEARALWRNGVGALRPAATAAPAGASLASPAGAPPPAAEAAGSSTTPRGAKRSAADAAAGAHGTLLQHFQRKSKG